MSIKDANHTKETIQDNIIVTKYEDARPIPGKRYFTQSRRIRNGIAVVIPFSNETAVELETTLTQLYITHQYLCNKNELWANRPFNILLIQDGWSNAHQSTQRYLKKIFPKQYFYNEIDATDDNNHNNIINGNQDEMINVHYDDYNNTRSQIASTPADTRTDGLSPATNINDPNNFYNNQTLSTMRPPLLEQKQSQSYEIKYDSANDRNDMEISKSGDYSIHYDDSYVPPVNGGGGRRGGGKRSSQSFGKAASNRNVGGGVGGAGGHGHNREHSMSEYAPSVAMDLPDQSQYWWEYFDEFDGSYKPKQGPRTFIFEKTVDNASYFQLSFQRNEKGRFDKRIEHQLKLHLTLIIKLDKRGKHNSREWFLAKSGFAEAYRATYLMTTNAFTLFDRKCLFSMVNYLDEYDDCSVVTGRQRAMTRGQQGTKKKESRCSMDYIFRLTQTFDWELSNNIYNPSYNNVGFLPVVPGQCGLYRAADILQDNARNWYFTQVNAKPGFTGLVLGNLQHVEDRLLTYAAILKVQGFRRAAYVSDALFYKQIDTNIEQLVQSQREWIDGTFSGFLYLLHTAKHHFWQWHCDPGQKYMIWFVFVTNLIQLFMMFFAPAISFRMLRTALEYLFANYLGGDEEIRTDGVLFFLWILFLVHIVIHNTSNFNRLIIYLLFSISILTTILTTFTYIMLLFVEERSVYDVFFKSFVHEETYELISYLVVFCILAPIPCSTIIGGIDSLSLLLKSMGAYFLTYHLMWSWVSSYAIVRCWDIDFDDNDHADDANAGDPLDNEEAEARERQQARFLQRSRLVMILLIMCNLAAYLVPMIGFIAIMIFLMTLAFFMAMSILSVGAKSVGVDLRFWELCCVLPEHRAARANKAKEMKENKANNNNNNKRKAGSGDVVHRPGDTRSEHNGRREQSVGTQSGGGYNGDSQSQREDSENSNEGFVIIPEEYRIQTKVRYDKMKTPVKHNGGGAARGYNRPQQQYSQQPQPPQLAYGASSYNNGGFSSNAQYSNQNSFAQV